LPFGPVLRTGKLQILTGKGEVLGELLAVDLLRERLQALDLGAEEKSSRHQKSTWIPSIAIRRSASEGKL